MEFETLSLDLASDKTTPAVRVAPDSDALGAHVARIAQALDLAGLKGTIAVVGGANDFDTDEFGAVRKKVAGLLSQVADVAAARHLAVIDGGTAHGIMRLMGEARAGQGGGFPLVGVVPEGRVSWAGRPEGQGGLTRIDAHHSAIVLVETDTWGGESDTLAALVHALAGDQPRLEVVVNGGDVTLRDVLAFLKHGSTGKVIVLAGTGRLADDIAAAIGAGRSDNPDFKVLLDSGRVDVVPLDISPADFSAHLTALFAS